MFKNTVYCLIKSENRERKCYANVHVLINRSHTLGRKTGMNALKKMFCFVVVFFCRVNAAIV